jgi:DNA-binding transcriptional MerR regulator
MTTAAPGLRISEVAARTGFSASALRFYEDAGLLEPARTPAGYRIYDDRSVERLRFIARAKALGLSLDEIAELLPAWEGDCCGEVAAPLGARIAEKLAASRERISELTRFVADLERAAQRLTTDASDGPCGDHCACAAPAREPLALTTRHRGETPDGAPIACTLDPADMRERVSTWRRLVSMATLREEISCGVRLTLPPGTPLGPIADLVAAELMCCAFLEVRISVAGAHTTIEVTAPTNGRSMVDELLGHPG